VAHAGRVELQRLCEPAPRAFAMCLLFSVDHHQKAQNLRPAVIEQVAPTS
jgi:hypothetical protein